MTSASPNDSLYQATKQANYIAQHATSFAAVLIAVFSIGCCANCMQPMGYGSRGAPQGYQNGGGYSGGYSPGAYSPSAGGQPGYGRPADLGPPARVTPWDPYTATPSQTPSRALPDLRPPSGSFGDMGRGGLGTGGYNAAPSRSPLPSPTGNYGRIYEPPPSASTDWTPMGTQPSTLRTPGFRDTRWPF